VEDPLDNAKVEVPPLVEDPSSNVKVEVAPSVAYTSIGCRIYLTTER